MNKFDRWMKRRLKAKYYIRYAMFQMWRWWM
jgi:hypothetical protein